MTLPVPKHARYTQSGLTLLQLLLLLGVIGIAVTVIVRQFA